MPPDPNLFDLADAETFVHRLDLFLGELCSFGIERGLSMEGAYRSFRRVCVLHLCSI